LFTAIICFAFLSGCIDMPDVREIKSVMDLQESAGTAATAVLPDEVAETFPAPVRSDGHVYIQILYYREVGPPGKRVVHAPHYCMRLDPYTAKVVRFWACSPQEIGIGVNTQSISPPGIRDGMTAEEFTEKVERLSTLSPRVWELFFNNATPADPQTLAMLEEYRNLFLATHNKEQSKWVIGASREFFSWLEKFVSKDR